VWLPPYTSCQGKYHNDSHSNRDTALHIQFSGQTHLDTFSIPFEKVAIDFDSPDDLAINGLRMAMEAIRLRAGDFSFWQRRRPVSRPAYEDRVVLIAILVQQLMDLSFRETEGMLAMMKDYFSIETVPDHSTICRKIQTDRFAALLGRFFRHITKDLPTRKGCGIHSCHRLFWQEARLA
jgi:hypothetical protein